MVNYISGTNYKTEGMKMKEIQPLIGPAYFEFETSDLKGKTFTNVYVNDEKDELVFENKKERITFYHSQDYSEYVVIEDVCGDLADLIGSEIIIAEEAVSGENPEEFDPEDQGSFTWTFYKFATRKGYVDVRWYGESNGFYSESVDVKYESLI